MTSVNSTQVVVIEIALVIIRMPIILSATLCNIKVVFV